MPGDNGQGSTDGATGGQEGSDTNQGGSGTNQDGTGANQGGSGTNQGGTTGGNQGGTGTGNNQGGTGTGNNQGGGTSGSSGGIIGGQGGFGSGNTAPSPSGSQNNLNQNLQNAVSGFVTQQSGGANGDVEILFAQQVDFPNGCLGLSDQGEMCSQAVTPGWQVVARSNGNLYVVHVDSNGNNVRWNQNADANAIIGSGAGTDGNQGGIGTGGTGTGNNQGGQSGGTNQGGAANDGGSRVGLDQVINLASQFLGQTLNVPVNQVSFSGVSVETWSDSCLGVGQANESCAQVTTPGYRISFNVGGQTYELRTDSTGSNLRLVQGGQQ